MKNFFKRLGTIVLVAVIGLSIITCPEPGGGGGGGKKPPPDVYVVNISSITNPDGEETDWDYMVFADKENEPALIFSIDDETNIPTRLFVKLNQDSDDGVTYTFKENGLPDRMITNGYIFIYDNFNGYQYDVAIIQPDPYPIQYLYNVQTDVNWDDFVEETALRSISIQGGERSAAGDTAGFWLDIASKAIGIGSCVVTAASMLAPPAAAAVAPTLGSMCVSFLITEGIGIAADIVSKIWGDDLPSNIAELLTNAYGCKDVISKNPLDIIDGALDCASLLVGLIDIIFGDDEKLVEENEQKIREAERALFLKNNPERLVAPTLNLPF